ncbi:MAG: S8/S53 family peptidase [Verrucomicrobia bacterium]|nr:S8/S53 family peptidase [Verrucomicrobiota bacterium]MBV8484324.1 S8/S53 family peptidase [Verrucomicrobiota bacterium]
MDVLTFLRSRSHREYVRPVVLIVLPVILTILSPLRAQASPSEQDLGATDGTQIVTASVVLNVRNLDALESYVASTQDRNSRFYHQFLSVPEFVRNFAPDSAQVAAVTQYLNSFGIEATEVYADNLLIAASGSVDAFNKAFALSIHDFSKAGERFHRPLQEATIPASLKDALLAIVGPSDEPRFVSHAVNLNDFVGSTPVNPNLVQPSKTLGATGTPGEYTVLDFANLYDVNPLYNIGINGSGQTIGIATLAAFHPSDAYYYWNLVGLKVSQHRIKVVKVDGGGTLNASGSPETSLDVEQSGGVAPGANIIVYDAPNTTAAFIDLFYKAASDNLVDSLSASWGEAEIYFFAALNRGVDHTGQLRGFHQAFLELAAQGISTFTSAADEGAYCANPKYNEGYGRQIDNVLSVDSPASDPAITAAGGTTLPITYTTETLDTLFKIKLPANTPSLVVSTQRVWGQDYLQDYLVKYVGKKFENYFFPSGGGGGVSIFWSLPAYQNGTSGIRQSEPGQRVVHKGKDLLNLPANFSGRNLPDVALNADPLSGYILVSSVLKKTYGYVSDLWGGTSFVAPQLNGVSALISQWTGQKRLGLWNPTLYLLQQSYGYGQGSPFVDITTGDNWYYYGVPGYEPAAGIGALDVTELANSF